MFMKDQDRSTFSRMMIKNEKLDFLLGERPYVSKCSADSVIRVLILPLRGLKSAEKREKCIMLRSLNCYRLKQIKKPRPYITV